MEHLFLASFRVGKCRLWNFYEFENRRRQVSRQRKEIQSLKRAGISTASAEEQFSRMVAEVIELRAERDIRSSNSGLSTGNETLTDFRKIRSGFSTLDRMLIKVSSKMRDESHRPRLIPVFRQDERRSDHTSTTEPVLRFARKSPLDRYHGKRDFKLTQEPKGKVGREGWRNLRYHDASRAL